MKSRKTSGKSHTTKYYHQATQTDLGHNVHYLRANSFNKRRLNFLRPGTLQRLHDMYQEEEQGLTPAGSTLPRAKRFGLIPPDAFISKESIKELSISSRTPANSMPAQAQKEPPCLPVSRPDSYKNLFEAISESMSSAELEENTSEIDRLPLDSPTSFELIEMYPEVQSALTAYRFFSPEHDTTPFNFDEFLDSAPDL